MKHSSNTRILTRFLRRGMPPRKLVIISRHYKRYTAEKSLYFYHTSQKSTQAYQLRRFERCILHIASRQSGAESHCLGEENSRHQKRLKCSEASTGFVSMARNACAALQDVRFDWTIFNITSCTFQSACRRKVKGDVFYAGGLETQQPPSPQPLSVIQTKVGRRCQVRHGSVHVKAVRGGSPVQVDERGERMAVQMVRSRSKLWSTFLLHCK